MTAMVPTAVMAATPPQGDAPPPHLGKTARHRPRWTTTAGRQPRRGRPFAAAVAADAPRPPHAAPSPPPPLPAAVTPTAALAQRRPSRHYHSAAAAAHHQGPWQRWWGSLTPGRSTTAGRRSARPPAREERGEGIGRLNGAWADVRRRPPRQGQRGAAPTRTRSPLPSPPPSSSSSSTTSTFTSSRQGQTYSVATAGTGKGGHREAPPKAAGHGTARPLAWPQRSSALTAQLGARLVRILSRRKKY